MLDEGDVVLAKDNERRGDHRGQKHELEGHETAVSAQAYATYITASDNHSWLIQARSLANEYGSAAWTAPAVKTSCPKRT